jgi:hypothetical protein
VALIKTVSTNSIKDENVIGEILWDKMIAEFSLDATKYAEK